ncbi:MAG: hypothetical protein JXD22_11380, partial [Sedimentisphaerales bacterium]|nr:hypothetical protein [Sedimentisphaerales bacterium]
DDFYYIAGSSRDFQRSASLPEQTFDAGVFDRQIQKKTGNWAFFPSNTLKKQFFGQIEQKIKTLYTRPISKTYT